MLALVAGQGRLPVLVARALAAGNAPWRLCALEDQPSEAHDLFGGERFRLERLGSLLAALRAEGVDEVCFAGAVRRPAIDQALIDAATAPLVPRLAGAMQGGDDTTLRAVLAVFEEAGLAVRAAHEVVPGLLAKPGCPTAAQPVERDRADADRAAAIAAALGEVDVGQSCVVAQGQALALEALPGTDRMLAGLPELADIRPDPALGRGVVYKGPKPGQDRRVDLPAIGPGTADLAAAADLAGIVVEAGGVLILDRDDVIARCDAAGLFLWAREPGR